MKDAVNRYWKLASRPQGMVKVSDFEWAEGPVPEVKDGQVLVRNIYISFDPTQRGWMEERPPYTPPIPLGQPMQALGAGQVVESKHPGFSRGDFVQGGVGWQDYFVSDGKGLVPLSKVPPGVPLPLAMGALGMTGLTAYFGLLDVGRPKEGETVVVSGAAGATGSVAGQIARIKGCRSIGIAGGKEKCAWLTGELGFDAAIDYKSEDVSARLRELCPNGIDVYFDNVGGEILDAALANLAMRGRVVICGAISQYNSKKIEGPKNYLSLLVRRGRMEGFMVFDYFARAGEAVAELGQWVKEGKLRHRDDIQEGLENAPKTMVRLFEGGNVGKLLLKIADPPLGGVA
jgi:NADPH-dependent curcumin reductase CurA